MKTIIVASFVLLCLGSSIAQVMPKTEYLEYLRGTEETATRLEKQLEAMKIEEMKMSYSKGEQLKDSQDIVLANLAKVHSFASIQRRYKPMLSNDIMITNSLDDASSMMSLLMDTLPESELGLYWTKTLAPLTLEVSKSSLPLRKHVIALADDLEVKAAKCR